MRTTPKVLLVDQGMRASSNCSDWLKKRGARPPMPLLLPKPYSFCDASGSR